MPVVERPPPLITFAELFEQALLLQHQRNSQRTVKIYFDSNDEYVREEQIPELVQSPRLDDSIDNYDNQQRILDQIQFKYRCVQVFFGNEERHITGTTRITRNIFAGTDRNENAMLFLDNMNKVKNTKHQ